ncbi:MAG TPA: GntR family transcriptional regulator, partial [Gemmatimonadetes bacterium]|nr:GntR family transcriptional regulator [Gemmatimonadota bacterium]
MNRAVSGSASSFSTNSRSCSLEGRSRTGTFSLAVSDELAIADAVQRDLESGVLSVGSRLPTHRDLAEYLGVTVGTVSRAYAEAERRG